MLLYTGRVFRHVPEHGELQTQPCRKLASPTNLRVHFSTPASMSCTFWKYFTKYYKVRVSQY